MEIIAFVVLGLIAAMAGSLLGLGGGFVIITALIFVFNYQDPTSIAFISMVSVLVITSLSTVRFHKMKRLDIKVDFIFGLSTIPGSIIGVFFSQRISSEYFQGILGTILILVAALQLIKSWKSQNLSHYNEITRQDDLQKKKIHKNKIMCLCFMIGILSAMLGIGGGVFLVPLFINLFHINAHTSMSTSTFVIFCISSSAFLTHVFSSEVDFSMNMVYIILGILPGVYIGTYFSSKMKPKLLIRTFAIIICLIGLKMIF